MLFRCRGKTDNALLRRRACLEQARILKNRIKRNPALRRGLHGVFYRRCIAAKHSLQ